MDVVEARGLLQALSQEVRLWEVKGVLPHHDHGKHLAPERFVCFSLRDCRVGPEDVTRLCRILAQCPQLTEIE